jgi:hypothetical protein
VSLSCACKEFVTLRVLLHKGTHPHTHTHTLSLSLSLSLSGIAGRCVGEAGSAGCCSWLFRAWEREGEGSIDVVMAETDP